MWYKIPGYKNYRYNPETQQVKSLVKIIPVRGESKPRRIQGEKILKKQKKNSFCLCVNYKKKQIALSTIHNMVFPKTYPPVNHKLVKDYCKLVGVSYKDLNRPKLQNAVSVKVSAVWYHLFYNHGIPAVDIGKKFFKNRTSINHGIKRFQDYLEVGYDDCVHNLDLLKSYKKLV